MARISFTSYTDDAGKIVILMGLSCSDFWAYSVWFEHAAVWTNMVVPLSLAAQRPAVGSLFQWPTLTARRGRIEFAPPTP